MWLDVVGCGWFETIPFLKSYSQSHSLKIAS
jgi:hypothetical protein